MKDLVDGVVRERPFEPETENGEFRREERTFRNWITADGSSGFPAEPGRYHLYVSLGCPWAHRTLIVRALKRLEAVISVAVVEPIIGPQGWAFGEASRGTADPLYGKQYLHEIYTMAQPSFTGIVTVPVLWDRRERTIVNNESSEIIRMFNSAFDAHGDARLDLYPKPLRHEIDTLNAWIYDRVNNGVYQAGFASTQAAYDQAVDRLFAALDELERRLSDQPYLVGERPTEADWRLFPTLVRFDLAYHGLFKCNIRRLVDYPRLWEYTRRLYQVPGVAETVRFDHIKRLYYSLPTLNPNGIIPKGSDLEDRFGQP